jgi:hypothetical protein
VVAACRIILFMMQAAGILFNIVVSLTCTVNNLFSYVIKQRQKAEI